MNSLGISSIFLRDWRIAEIVGEFAWYRVWFVTNSIYVHERTSRRRIRSPGLSVLKEVVVAALKRYVRTCNGY